MKEGKKVVKRGSIKEPGEKFLQDILFEETILVMKKSLEVKTISELINILHNEFPQNSPNTRLRYTSIILGRFFPNESLNEFPVQFYRNYKDENLLREIIKVLLPIKEPIIGEMIQNYIYPLQPGTQLPRSFFMQFVKQYLKRENKNVSVRCYKAALNLGWTSKEKGKTYVLKKIPNPTAFFLILHYFYAQQPTIIEFQRIIKDGYWKYFGFRDIDEIKENIRVFESKNLISRYSKVDRLEQITTKHPLEELIEMGVRI